MLHILWLILKFILILLGIVLGLILLAVLLLLFCPVRYRGIRGRKRNSDDWKEIRGERKDVKLARFAVLLLRAVWADGKNCRPAFRLFGIPVGRNSGEQRREKNAARAVEAGMKEFSARAEKRRIESGK